MPKLEAIHGRVSPPRAPRAGARAFALVVAAQLLLGGVADAEESTSDDASPDGIQEPPSILVHIDSTVEASLVRVDVPHPTECVAPCDRALPLAGTYVIRGPGLSPSDPFQLEGKPRGRVVLTVSPGYVSSYATGRAVVATGVLTGVTALLAAVLAEIYVAASGEASPANYTGSNPCSACSGASAMAISGIVVMAVGSVVGGSMMLLNGTTGASQEVHPPPRPPRIPDEDANWRQPDRIQPPRAATVRLLELHF